MTYIISVVSQKGGVGKSTIARLIAREYTSAGWEVKLADLDPGQGTSTTWATRRRHYKVEPDVAVEQFSNAHSALKRAESYDLIVMDGAPHATRDTLEMARASQLVIIPTGLAMDDLGPCRLLAQELKDKGIPAKQIAIVLNKTGDSEAERYEAATYLRDAGLFVLKSSLPDKVGYRRALDLGKTVSETNYPTLNGRAGELAQEIVNRLKDLSNNELKGAA